MLKRGRGYLSFCPPSPATTTGLLLLPRCHQGEPSRGWREGDTWENLAQQGSKHLWILQVPSSPFMSLNSQDENTGLSSHSFRRQENAPSVSAFHRAGLDARNWKESHSVLNSEALISMGRQRAGTVWCDGGLERWQ